MESEVCRCCLGSDRLQSMAETCVEYNKSHVEMLKECFDINIYDYRPWICAGCITKLTDAYNFHTQVRKAQNYFNPTAETIRIFKTEVDVEHDTGSTEEYEEHLHSEEHNQDSLDTDMEIDNLSLSHYRTLGKDEFLNEIAKKKSIEIVKNYRQSSCSKTFKTLIAKKNLLLNEIKEMPDSDKRTDILNDKSVNTEKGILKQCEFDDVSEIYMKKFVQLENLREKKKKLLKEVKSMPVFPLNLKVITFKSNKKMCSKPISSQPQKITSREFLKYGTIKPAAFPSTPKMLKLRKNIRWAEYMADELKSLGRDCIDYYLFTRNASQYKCGVCQETYADTDNFKKHTRQHSCEETENVLRQAKIWRLKVDISSMKCRHCNEPVTELDAFRSHLSIAHDVVPKDLFCRLTPFNLNRDEIRCVICAKVFANILNLTKHMNNHSTNCICPHCGKSFVEIKKMRGHIRQSHTSGSFKCNICDEIFGTIAKKDYHVSHKHRKRWNLCPHCPEKLPSFHAKMIHLAKAHNEELKKYKCQSCPAKFVTSSLLSSHTRKVHLQERNHVCPECDDAFFQKRDLVRHMIKHSEEKNYACQVCSKAYARQNTLKEHMRIHDDDRRHVCPICGRGFVQKCVLKSHLRVHAKDVSDK